MTRNLDWRAVAAGYQDGMQPDISSTIVKVAAYAIKDIHAVRRSCRYKLISWLRGHFALSLLPFRLCSTSQ
jgi:hypothetical protein